MRRIIARLVIITISTCVSVQGGALFSHEVSAGGSETGDGNMDYLTFPIMFSNVLPQSLDQALPQTQIFSNPQWGIADVGTTVTITPATDPDFNAFTAMLTDGTQEYIGFGLYSHPAFNEQFFFDSETTDVWGHGHPPGEVDLQGFQIDSYSITLNSLSISNNAITGTANYLADYTFTANGEPLPEPSIAGFTALVMCLLRRRRHPAGRTRFRAE